MHVSRLARRALLLCLLLVLLPTCGGSNAPSDPTPPPTADPVPVGLMLVAGGIPSPVVLTHAGDGSGRLFVVSQTGQIRVIDAGGNLLPTPFLDIAGLGLMVALDATFDERGLLGLAFHPDYGNNGRFFVRYSAPRAGMMGDPCFGTTRGCHTAVLSEFSVQGDPATNNVADPNSERVIFTIDQPQFNHNSGHVAFGPDGHLYFTLGDGGGAHDGLADSPPSHGPTGNGQNVDTLLGAVLRIDVDTAPPVGDEYVVPADNPFAQGPGADEIYAYGLRNPYRFSFDSRPGGTDQLFVADVGQNLFEELNIVTKGGNYGWVVREGFVCFDPQNPEDPPAACASTGPLGEPLRDPVLVYGHDIGLAIVGGFVYRGAGVPALQGKYVFGDWSTGFGDTDGHLFACDIAGPTAFVRRALQIQPGDVEFGKTVLGFGEDEAGEVYVLGGTVSAPGGSGTVERIVAAP
jgi:glucose/arabinose dehydrogenase